MLIKRIIGAVVGLALIGLAFYGGRVYQNHADQTILNEYTPAQSNAAGRTRRFLGL